MLWPVNILVAFPYFKKSTVDLLRKTPKENYRLIVDSGAFTAWNTGRSINLDDYCRFLDSMDELQPFYAVQLDVFGDPEGTWKNYLTMKSRGYNVMPVFTRGDTLDRLEEMYSLTDYIMFGGITTGGKNINYVKWFMEKNKGRKVHWLGFCNMDFVKFFKPFSIDSSSWASGARFGNLQVYSGFGKTTSFNRKTLITMPETKIFQLAKNSGLTVNELALLRDQESWINSPNLPSLKKPERATAMFMSCITSVHRAYEVEKNLGTRFYLAACAVDQIEKIFRAREFLIERGIINDRLNEREQRPGPQVPGIRENRVPDDIRPQTS